MNVPEFLKETWAKYYEQRNSLASDISKLHEEKEILNEKSKFLLTQPLHLHLEELYHIAISSNLLTKFLIHLENRLKFETLFMLELEKSLSNTSS